MFCPRWGSQWKHDDLTSSVFFYPGPGVTPVYSLSLYIYIFIYLPPVNRSDPCDRQHIGLHMFAPTSRPKRIYQMTHGVLNLPRNALLDWMCGHSLISCHVEHHLFPFLSDNMCLKVRLKTQIVQFLHVLVLLRREISGLWLKTEKTKSSKVLSRTPTTEEAREIQHPSKQKSNDR